MKRLAVGALFLTLAACTPPQPPGADNPEAVVRGVYDIAQQNVGHAVTPADAIPMTDDLKSLLDRAAAAAAARDEPFIEGDLALNGQDCTSISDLAIGAQTGALQEPTEPGHAWVEARFKLNGEEDRRVLWDMAQSGQSWRVDNIIADGYDLRAEAQSYLADADVNPPAP